MITTDSNPTDVPPLTPRDESTLRDESLPPPTGTDPFAAEPVGGRSLGDLIRELRDEGTLLLRQEVALAKTEMAEKIGRMGRNIGYIIAGGAICHLALIFLLLAVAGGIELALSQTDLSEHAVWLAPLIVGGLIGLIGVFLIVKAIKTLGNTSLSPDRTIESIKEDKQWVKAKVAEGKRELTS